VDKLRKLAEVYRRDPAGDTWMVKQRLGAHYCLFGGTRHALMSNLLRVDWREYTDALRRAVEGGAQLVLVGEDLGLDPATGLSVCPYEKPTQTDAVAGAMAGARWCALSADGEIVRASLGRGSLVLSRITPDGASSSWGYAAAWQKRLRRIIAADRSRGAIPPPDAELLRRWLTGEAALVAGPRTAVWRGGWEAEVGRRPVWKDDWVRTFDPGKDTTGPVFVLRLPPTGEVLEAKAELALEGEGPVGIDIGADGSVEGECAPGARTALPWAEAINAHLAWREEAGGGVERDLNGWRLVPIRFRASCPFEVRVEQVVLKLE
jgi:hypothetical protein